MFQTALSEGFPMFKDKTTNFLSNKIKSNNLKRYFNHLFANAKNAGTVHVVESFDHVPERFRQRAEKMTGSEGFYIPNTGETYFITGNIKNAAEAFKTWVHEVGVHKGLENIIPRHLLNPMFEKIYDDLGANEIQRNIPESYHDKDKSVQAEEYLAYLGEKIINEKELSQKEKGIWTKIVEAVKNILNKLFTGVKFTQTDAENIVRAAVQSVYQPPTGEGKGTLTKKDVRPRNVDIPETIIRLDNLKVARQMEAAEKSAKEIRLATGWEKGADNKWRYELPDNITVNKIPVVNEGETSNVYKFNDIFDSKELLNAYPQIKEALVIFTNDKLQPEGKYIKEANVLIFNTNEKLHDRDLRLPSNDTSFKIGEERNDYEDDLGQAIIHEIQHFIQVHEGFAEGSSAETIQSI
jgi:hypothetical protein